MTKVQLNYDLLRPLNDSLMNNIARAHSLLGMLRLQVSPNGAGLQVDYDASRLTIEEVEASLHQAGLAVRRQG